MFIVCAIERPSSSVGAAFFLIAQGRSVRPHQSKDAAPTELGWTLGLCLL